MNPVSKEVDISLCTIHRSISEIYENIEKTKQKIKPKIINFSLIESRNKLIKELKHITTELDKLKNVANNQIEEANKIHQEELAIVRKYIDFKDHNDNDVADQEKRDKVELVSKLIKLDENIELNAIIIPANLTKTEYIFDKITTPDLYYIPQWDHFAVRCGDMVFHGNVGVIYSNLSSRVFKVPSNIMNCKYGKSCTGRAGKSHVNEYQGTCTYYHDPAICEGSKDIRNFIASSWTYKPLEFGHTRTNSRRFGSRDNLQYDLYELTKDDAQKFIDQTSHDIICSLILSKYILAVD